MPFTFNHPPGAHDMAHDYYKCNVFVIASRSLYVYTHTQKKMTFFCCNEISSMCSFQGNSNAEKAAFGYTNAAFYLNRFQYPIILHTYQMHISGDILDIPFMRTYLFLLNMYEMFYWASKKN